MRNCALPGDFAITPPRPLIAAEESRDGLQLIRAASRESVLCVRAAGEKKRIITISRVNLAFYIFDVGMRQLLGH
jgi:hypothetical protein